MIKAVIFDMGGVLLRTEDFSGRIKWENRFGVARGELDRIVFNGDTAALAAVGKANKYDIWNAVGKHFGIVDSDLLQLEQDFWSGDRIDRNLLEFAQNLRCSYKTAILSNAWPEARRMLVEKYKVTPAFDHIIISAEERVAKPDRRIYEIAADRLGVLPSECIFVDDFTENIAGALEAGMQAILFTETGQIIADINHKLYQG